MKWQRWIALTFISKYAFAGIQHLAACCRHTRIKPDPYPTIHAEWISFQAWFARPAFANCTRIKNVQRQKHKWA